LLYPTADSWCDLNGILQSRNQIPNAEMAVLKTQSNFKAVNHFWLPVTAAEFEKSDNELKAEVVK